MSGGDREALLTQGALLFARHGIDAVSTRQLHDAIGTRNESALHYHFGNRAGLVAAILRQHLELVESRRAVVVDELVASGSTSDVRALVGAIVRPLAASLADPVGRARLRLVARLNEPALAYAPPFRLVPSPAGRAVVRWLVEALAELPAPVRTERLAALRAQVIRAFADRAQLVDDGAERSTDELFVANLIDQLVAGLLVAPSEATLEVLGVTARRAPRRTEPRRRAR